MKMIKSKEWKNTERLILHWKKFEILISSEKWSILTTKNTEATVLSADVHYQVSQLRRTSAKETEV